MLEMAFEENCRRVKQDFHRQGSSELAELDQIRHKLAQIKGQIQDY